MDTWAKAPAPRHQLVLVSQTVDDIVAPEHAVRVVDEFLEGCDWKAWEARYDGRRGQPPIHPRCVAGAILYGLMKGIRSSRELEDATRERIDFVWLLGGRTIDHSTFAAFRTKFEKELKDLNRQISRSLVFASGAGAAALLEMILDGTRVRANSERLGARTAAALEKLIEAGEKRLNEKLAQMESADAQEEQMKAMRAEMEQLCVEVEQLASSNESIKAENNKIRTEKDKITAELEKHRTALEEVKKRDAVKRKADGKNATPVRVPVTDPDATLLPNKEGGFAPNYTPTAAVEATSGAIISADVVSGGDEASAVALAVKDCEALLGRKPSRLLADNGFASGANLELLEESDVEAYMNMGAGLSEKNPANRPDPTQPVAEQLRANLPLLGKRLAPSAFIYNAEKDIYHCPMGQALRRTGRNCRHGGVYRIYACPGKADCPLAAKCVKGDAPQRTVARDAHQPARERTAQRMASEAGRAIYKKRAPLIEGVFGTIKHALGIRQFLLRGLPKVRTEWNWICGAYNLRKMVRLLQQTPCAELN